MKPVYSHQFIATAGLSGTGSSVVVPDGLVYVVRFVTAYCSPGAATVNVFFQDDVSGAALLSTSGSSSNDIRFAQDCRFVFDPGHAFHFQVDVSIGFTAAADVSASGFVLTLP